MGMKHKLKVLVLVLCGFLLSGISHAEDEWKSDSCLPDVLAHGLRMSEPLVEWDAGAVSIGETQEEDYLVGRRVNGPAIAAFVCFRRTNLPTQGWVGASTVGNPEIIPGIYSSSGWLQNFFVLKDIFGDNFVAYTASFQGVAWSGYDGKIRFPVNGQMITMEGVSEVEEPWTTLYTGGGVRSFRIFTEKIQFQKYHFSLQFLSIILSARNIVFL